MRIVHASDLHFGEIPATASGPARSAHFFVDKDKKPQPKDLSSILTKNGCFDSPDIFVVSGDIGWSGIENDYKYFLQFIDCLKKKWSNTSFIIAPGNHDLDLACADDLKRQDAFNTMLRKAYGSEYKSIYKLLDLDEPDLDKRERLIGFHYCKNKYLIISANSAASINSTSDSSYIRPSVLRAISDQIKPHREEDNLFRAFVVHHHLLPFYESDWHDTIDARAVHEKTDTDVMLNSAKIQSWLSSEGFNLVLHGHKHLFHGREDALWREGDDGVTRKLVILGAGSSGVMRKELAPRTSHSANVIDVQQLSATTWKLDTNTFGINEDIHRAPASLAKKKLNSGIIKDPPICTYNAHNIALCHAAIRADLLSVGTVTNFISSVEISDYVHPESAAIGDQHATKDEVWRSFIALHPEYDMEDGWLSTEKVDRVLANLPRSFRIQHGPRLFSPAAIIEPYSGLLNIEDLRPITRAIKALPGYGTRAYAGLYNLEKDAIGDFEPMPGLVGVQFNARDSEGLLDIVFTFRNLELSFWWVVNMLEARQLLEWACAMVTGRNYKPGRVTFFSPSAEWRKDPRPMFLSTIDEMKDEELFVLLVSSSAGSSSHKTILADLIDEKKAHTTSLNIQYQGLERILGLAKGVGLLSDGKPPLETLSMDIDFVNGVECATVLLRKAVNESKDRGVNVERAKKELGKAVATLRKAVAS